MNRLKSIILICSFTLPVLCTAQIDEEQLGAWYMYFWDAPQKAGHFGAQGDIQYRAWDLGEDMEQLMLRGGITYKPDSIKVKFTLGYANITSGSFGNSTETRSESRIYQEVLFPTRLGRVHLNHRFRYEQRRVSLPNNFPWRTRYRYNLFVNVPLNQKELSQGAIYLALYNELFINGQRNEGYGEVEIFDRNRFYSALGYKAKKNLAFQLGLMRQSTDSWTKNQLQVSAHHRF